MTALGTHYERALEAYLQCRRIRYVAVDQARKGVFAGVKIKSFDFIVYPPHETACLIDVKGRKFSLTSYQKGLLGQNWVTRDDIEGLSAWQKVFGESYRCAFVFAYWLTGGDADYLTPAIFPFDRRLYAFYIIDLVAYQRHQRPRSPKWNTLDIPARLFRQLADPLNDMI